MPDEPLPPTAPAAIPMVDEAGAAVDVPHDAVRDAFLGKGYGFAQGSRVPMVAANGQFGHVEAGKAQEAFSSGARIATPAEIHKAQIHAEYDNFGGFIASGAAEAANQALLGAGDALAVGAAKVVGSRETAEKVRRTLADLREENPASTVAGGVVGALAPLALTGGESAAARILSAPTRALGAVGDVAEHAAAASVPQLGASMAARVAHEAVVQGARAGAEGAILGAGNDLTEQTLEGGPELNGEKLLAALGHGALLGGAAGGLLGAGGALGRGVLGRSQPALDRAAGEQAFRALNPRLKFAELGEDLPGGAAGVGNELLDRGVLQAGDKLTDIAPKVAAARKAAGEELGVMLGDLDAMGAAHAPDAAKVIDRIRTDVIEPLAKLPGYEHEIAEVTKYLESFATKTQEGLTFTGLRDIRAALDDKIYRGSNALNPSPVMKELQRMRGIVEDELTVAGDKAAATLGEDFSTKYNDAKLSYRRLALADKAAQKSASAMIANRVISPTDYLAGIAGFAGGGLHGGLTGLALGAAHHVIRERGNATAAVLLDKVAAFAAIQRASRVVDAEVDRGIAGLLEPGKRAQPKVKAGAFASSSNPYRSHADAVTGAVRGAESHAGDVENAVTPIVDHAPKTAKAFQAAAIRTTIALHAVLPKGHLPPPSVTPQFDEPVVSDAERERFERARAIAHDPVGVTFARAAKGQLTKSDVDLFKKSSPALYQDVVARTQEQLARLKAPLDTTRESQLRVLMGMPPADPQLAGIMQNTYVTPAGQPQPNQGPTGSGPKATPKQREGLANRERLAGLNSDTEGP